MLINQVSIEPIILHLHLHKCQNISFKIKDQCKCNTDDCINVIELSYVNGFKSSNDRDGRVWQDGVVCDWCHLYYCQECLNADLIMLFDGYGDRLICTKCLDKGISDQTITECDVCDNNHKTIQYTTF